MQSCRELQHVILEHYSGMTLCQDCSQGFGSFSRNSRWPLPYIALSNTLDIFTRSTQAQYPRALEHTILSN